MIFFSKSYIQTPVSNALIKFLGFSLLIIHFVFLSACNDKPETTQKSKPTSPLAVAAASVEYRSLNHTITVSGTLEPSRSVRLYNQIQGLLLELPYHEGDQVNKGVLLARLDDTIIKAEYDKANATLKQSRLDYGRLEKLAPTNLTSRELLTRAKTKMTLDEAEYSLQKQRLSYTRIRAPWSGVISERLVEPGDVLPLHSHFMSLIDLSSLIVRVPVSELYLSKIKQGDNISFIIDALGNKSWQGNVLRIYPEINAQTRKGFIEVSLSPVPQGAKPGQLARISITTPEEQVLVIPISAIRYDQQGAYVYVINEDNTVYRSNIITGKKYPEMMEVLDGLKAGQSVVKKGLFGLRSGKKVKILTADSTDIDDNNKIND